MSAGANVAVAIGGGLLVVIAAVLAAAPRSAARGRLRGLTGAGMPAGPAALARTVARRAERSGRSAAGIAAVGAAVVGLMAAGPMAAVLCGGYACAGVRAVLRRRARRTAEALRVTARDAVTVLSDDLRAGLPPSVALGRAWPRLIDDTTEAAMDARATGSPEAPASSPLVPEDPVPVLRADSEPARATVTARLATAWQLAAETGAPLADVLDRLDTELTDRERVHRRAAAQAAGAKVTTLLLALLPAAGLALGYAIGADPLRILLHTAVGAVCAAGMLGLQLAGVLWSGRLADLTTGEVPTW